MCRQDSHQFPTVAVEHRDHVLQVAGVKQGVNVTPRNLPHLPCELIKYKY